MPTRMRGFQLEQILNLGQDSTPTDGLSWCVQIYGYEAAELRHGNHIGLIQQVGKEGILLHKRVTLLLCSSFDQLLQCPTAFSHSFTDAAPALLLSPSLWGYLEDYRLSQRPESYNLMKQTLEEFVAFVKKQEVSSITRIDLLKYKQWLVNRGRSVRTAGNKMLRVNQFLRSVQKLEPGKGLVTVRDGKFVETEPEVFTQEELTAFFAACNGFQFLVFKTFLMSGLRKQELESLEWTDVNFTASTLKVSAKAGFQPKTWEERTIEIPSDLLDMLRTAMRRSHLVFANKNGNKYTHAWDDCQSIAAKAGIEDAHPHKFRASYATKLLQSGVDLKTVQKLLGHKNLESTMRYLAKAQSHKVRAKVDAVWNKKPPQTVKTGKHEVPMETKIVWSEE
jgi:integrase